VHGWRSSYDVDLQRSYWTRNVAHPSFDVDRGSAKNPRGMTQAQVPPSVVRCGKDGRPGKVRLLRASANCRAQMAPAGGSLEQRDERVTV
jgi:hypothetical protein